MIYRRERTTKERNIGTIQEIGRNGESEAIHAKEKKSRIGTATATEAVNDVKRDMMTIENMAGMNDETECCEFYNIFYY